MSESTQSQNVEFENLSEDKTKSSNSSYDLDLILNIEVTLSVVIGQAQITIGELLKLNQGSVVELDQLVGQSFNIMVNNTLIAHGEVVIVGDKFGIRFTEVVSPKERLEKLT